MSSFGSNLGFVDELYADFLQDPSSVSESWREFFEDYEPASRVTPRPSPRQVIQVEEARSEDEDTAEDADTGEQADSRREDVESAEPARGEPAQGEPLTGIPLKMAENMERSLSVPTATSAREVAVKLLEENRRLINRHRAALAKSKVSFTHLIAWAIVRALELNPRMNAAYRDEGGEPRRVQHEAVHFGLAIDMEKRGRRLLLVPSIKNAQDLTFEEFLASYDEIVARARAGKLTLEDFGGTTVTLTNPGTIGTVLSVPRLMAGQGLIVGTGAIGYPAELTGTAPEVISELGLSKTMTITSTYDHRVIQGAESGTFLSDIARLLQGEERFYDQLFEELAVPHEPVEWASDASPSVVGGNHNVEAIRKQAAVLTLIRAYRVRGHLWADLNPLGFEPKPNPELELSTYGLSLWDLDREFVAGSLAGEKGGRRPLRDILETLREAYTHQVGAEFMHIPEPEPRDWLQRELESERARAPFSQQEQRRILTNLNRAEALETFLHGAYVGQKRFSLEGAETLIPMLVFLFDDARRRDVREAVIGMPHRGRLNVLANVLGKSYDKIFREFEGDMNPATPMGAGDVKYHLGATGRHETPDGQTLELILAPNPSHLEAVDPVVEGMVRARQDAHYTGDRASVLPVLLHGDAAFSGQGVVAETLGLSKLVGYRTGGTVHIVVNNQIGFTAGPDETRSSMYATDVAKAVHAPIFHVNGDYPEAAIRVMRVALAFRQTFQQDVVVDLICYRRWGHNEADDPSYTNPVMYERIERHRSVRKLYTERLLRRGDLDRESAEQALDDFRDRLRAIHDAVEEPSAAVDIDTDREASAGRAATTSVTTAVDDDVIERIMTRLETFPEDFTVHPKLKKQIGRRRQAFEDDAIDWALAEAFAFGSLVLGGHRVRLSGEDSARGTFSQRHSVLHDHRTGRPFVPLANLSDEQASFCVHDSLLSEFAVLGFEYGYSVQAPEALTLWEAQFGDFVNGGQVIIDQFIASAEDKWGLHSGLVMLLPHGYEGQGPEHSSARLERFLQLCAEGNMCVCYPSTPAQYFHLLRRQVLADGPQRPLVVLTPKSLLRLPAAASARSALTKGAFHEVLFDDADESSGVGDGPVDARRRVIFCSGKLYYDLDRARREREITDVALVRVEQFYPTPTELLSAALKRYGTSAELVWAQEEPRNMGAWRFVSHHLQELAGPERAVRYAGRPPSASTATGSHRQHDAEQLQVIDEALQ